MYELFPGDYAWSQAALRGIFSGGTPGEVLRAVERLAGAAPGDGEAWYAAWDAVGAAAAARGERNRADGHGLTLHSLA